MNWHLSVLSCLSLSVCIFLSVCLLFYSWIRNECCFMLFFVFCKLKHPLSLTEREAPKHTHSYAVLRGFGIQCKYGNLPGNTFGWGGTVLMMLWDRLVEEDHSKREQLAKHRRVVSPSSLPFSLSFRGKNKALSNKTFCESHASLARSHDCAGKERESFWVEKQQRSWERLSVLKQEW